MPSQDIRVWCIGSLHLTWKCTEIASFTLGGGGVVVVVVVVKAKCWLNDNENTSNGCSGASNNTMIDVPFYKTIP